VAYGAYLAGPVAHCMECTTPQNGRHLDLSRLGTGGREFPISTTRGADRQPQHHPGPETGIGQWSDADVKAAILLGIRPDGTKLTGRCRSPPTTT